MDTTVKTILSLLEQIHKQNPTVQIGRAIQTAIDWQKNKTNEDLHEITNKQLKIALEKFLQTAENIKKKEIEKQSRRKSQWPGIGVQQEN